jgi:TANK-binding kinase 1
LHLWSKIHVVTKDLFRLFPYDDNISSNSLENILQLARSHYNDVSNQMTSISPSVKQLCQRVVRDESLAKEWASTNRSFSVLNGICGKSTTYVTRLKDSWQHLLRDRAARGKNKFLVYILCYFYLTILYFTVLTYNDEQFHLLERIKMTETFKSLESLFTAECVPTVTNTADLLADWYKYETLAVFLLREKYLFYISYLEWLRLLCFKLKF